MSAEFPGPVDCILSAKYNFELWAGSLKTPGCEQVEESGGWLDVMSVKRSSLGREHWTLTLTDSDSSEGLLHGSSPGGLVR